MSRWARLEALPADVPGRLAVTWLVSLGMGKDMLLEISPFESPESTDMATVTPSTEMHVLDVVGEGTT